MAAGTLPIHSEIFDPIIMHFLNSLIFSIVFFQSSEERWRNRIFGSLQFMKSCPLNKASYHSISLFAHFELSANFLFMLNFRAYFNWVRVDSFFKCCVCRWSDKYLQYHKCHANAHNTSKMITFWRFSNTFCASEMHISWHIAKWRTLLLWKKII